MIARLLPVSLLMEDLPRARAFYEGILGLEPSAARPVMSFEGVWYDIELAISICDACPIQSRT
jgi:glyoxylase I family protein